MAEVLTLTQFYNQLDTSMVGGACFGKVTVWPVFAVLPSSESDLAQGITAGCAASVHVPT